MKNIIIILLLFNLTSYGQWNDISEKTSKPDNQRKIQKFERMKTTGTFLTIFGAAGLCGGVALAATGFGNMLNEMNTTNTQETGAAQFEGGIILAVVGGAALITGIVLSSVGKKNIKKYKKLDYGFRYNNKVKGLMLSYKF